MSRLLLVEDDEHLAEGMAFNLRNHGYQVETVDNGEAALETAARQSFDDILLDVMLPGIDGFEVVRRLRQAGNMRPVLILTAKNRADDTIAGLNAGADDYITKPFDLDEVLARIRGALRRQAWTHGSSPAEDRPDVLRRHRRHDDGGRAQRRVEVSRCRQAGGQGDARQKRVLARGGDRAGHLGFEGP